MIREQSKEERDHKTLTRPFLYTPNSLLPALLYIILEILESMRLNLPGEPAGWLRGKRHLLYKPRAQWYTPLTPALLRQKQVNL